ncbi:MAG: hypothetical protein RI973_1690 [Bacteroidota bacterium]
MAKIGQPVAVVRKAISYYLNMKNIILLLLAVFSMLSCRKEDTPPLVRIPVTNLSFTVDPTLQPGFEYYIPINGVRTNAMQLLDARGIDTSDIKRVMPGRARLSIIFAQANLDFIDAVSIRLCPLGQDQENCGQEAFYRDPVPLGTGTDIDLIPSNVEDLRGFVLPDQINVQVKLERLRNFPAGSFDILLDMEFDVRG